MKLRHLLKPFAASRPNDAGTCLQCSRFRNHPDYLESVFKGLNCLSSGRASVRKDDGICLENDLYLSAADWCDRFVPVPRKDPDPAA
jgi:hypothetical protein